MTEDSGWRRKGLTGVPRRRVLFSVILLAALSTTAGAQSPPSPGQEAGTPLPSGRPITPGATTRRIEGWTVHIRPALLESDREATEAALGLLRKHLAEIRRVVPGPALARIRRVPLWFSPEYPGIPPRAEYHPGADWLRDNGRDPAMAKGVEFTNVRIFAQETDRMPCFVLHELSHAYHDQVLGFDNPEVLAAYAQAKASGSYDRVERRLGGNRPNTFERAYALTNPQEYFAESCEAYFGRNDFAPFTREELKKQDPVMAALLQRLWALPLRKAPGTR